MEPRFGFNFGRVRVHADSQAAISAQELGALAYTVGHDVVFAAGQFAPHTAFGRRLLAHELTHTIQQASANRTGETHFPLGSEEDVSEQVAERASASVLSGSPGMLSRISQLASPSDPRVVLRRQPGPRHAPETNPTPKKEERQIALKPDEPDTCPSSPDLRTLFCTPQPLANKDFLKVGAPEDALGFTKADLPNSRAPEILTAPAGKDKAVVVQPTKAKPAPCESYFTKATKDPITRIYPLKAEVADPELCGGKYERLFRITPDGEKRIEAAEKEHCEDLKYAFDISLGCYEAVVNDFAKKKTEFPSPEAAEEAIRNRVGRPSDKWMLRYGNLVQQTEVRDVRKWHDAGPPGAWEDIKPYAKGHCRAKDIIEVNEKSFPQVKKHLTKGVIK